MREFETYATAVAKSFGRQFRKEMNAELETFNERAAAITESLSNRAQGLDELARGIDARIRSMRVFVAGALVFGLALASGVTFLLLTMFGNNQ